MAVTSTAMTAERAAQGGLRLSGASAEGSVTGGGKTCLGFVNFQNLSRKKCPAGADLSLVEQPSTALENAATRQLL
jgi:hypothetical protein